MSAPGVRRSQLQRTLVLVAQRDGQVEQPGQQGFALRLLCREGAGQLVQVLHVRVSVSQSACTCCCSVSRT